ncbi:uncharacterized protein LOC109838519 [Asparagus officinalis]|uniref:uncharacterized protein LOC109838519 n=1 Tax=Asparagus officinalis TaxID=4686 RepID=UPI00098E829A|nr:uncharacterized protein LOC109838519 [Asparagus officinalis]
MIRSYVGIFSVSVLLTHNPSNWTFTFTSVYAPIDREDKAVCWWELSRLRQIFEGPWVICGDFNATLSSEERNGRKGSIKDINSFKSFVSSNYLIDLPLSGRSFTWSNNRQDPALARLDRFLVCAEWDKNHPLSLQFSPPSVGSDHFPIILDSRGIKPNTPMFKFEKSWFHNITFVPFIETSWKSFSCQGTPVDKFITKLKLLKRRIKWWRKNVHESISSRKNTLLSKIHSIDLIEEQRSLSPTELDERKAFQSSFASIIQEEESYWHQRSRIQWLKEGDTNTSFFHRTASTHKRSNHIVAINHMGSEIADKGEISKVFYDFYHNLFGQENNSNILAPYMNDLVAPTQSAFQSGKSTLDSIAVANEMIHFCSKRKKDVAMVKIDFAKAFDSINWNFLINLLKMIRHNVEEGLLSNLGIKEPLNQIRSLQFADDTLLFVKSTKNDISILKAILYIFEDISGLGINFSKSSLIYFGNLHNRGQTLAAAMNCNLDHLPIKYLGLPLKYGKLAKSDWQPMLDNMYRKLASWKSSCLSFGGRLVLLNSVLSSILLYYMSFYKLPSWVIKEVDKIRKNFLWTGKNISRPFKCLANWKTVCLSKFEGGLGVKDLKIFNNALLSKWLWKCLDRDSLTRTLLHQLYIRRDSQLQSSSCSSANSKFWNDIISIKDLFLHLLQWSLGSGDKIRFWEDKWTGSNTLSSLYPILYKLSLSTNVSIWLHTKENLIKKGWQGDSTCILCDIYSESCEHLFFECSFTKSVWKHFCEYYLPFIWPTSLYELLKSVESLRYSDGALWRSIFTAVCWSLWTSRNKFIFENSLFSATSVINSAISNLHEWSGSGRGKKALKLAAVLEERPILRSNSI